MPRNRRLPLLSSADQEVRVQVLERLNSLQQAYQSFDGDPKSPEAIRLYNPWHSHFENAIKASDTTELLEQLQLLPCPSEKLAKKLEGKLRQLSFPNPGFCQRTEQIPASQPANA